MLLALVTTGMAGLIYALWILAWVLVIVLVFAGISYIVRQITIVPQQIAQSIVWVICLIFVLLYLANNLSFFK